MDVEVAASDSAVRLEKAEIKSIILGLLVAMLLAALDQTIVGTAMPTIGRELGDIANLPWVVTAYLLTSTVVTPLYGKLSDIHGRRIMLLWAIGIFSLGSIACALAPNMLGLVLARGLQGLGGGGLIALAQTIIGDIVPPRERAQYVAYITSVFVTSSLAGPVLGGFFAEKLHWTLIFWINLPLGALAFFMTNSKLKRLPRHERPHKLDLTGAALLVAATSLLLLALSWGGTHYAWLSLPILSLIVFSAVLWGLFFGHLQRAVEPLIPVNLLQNQVVRMATLAACFGMGTFIGLSIYMPIYLEGVLKFPPDQSGLALIPLMVGTVTGATLSGTMMPRLKHYKRLPMTGLSISVLATMILALAPDKLPFWELELLLASISVGLGTVLPVTTIAVQNAVDFHQLGTATASMNFFRSLGGALIVAVFGTLILGGGATSGVDLHDLTPEGLAMLQRAFRFVFAASSLGLALALLFIVRMEERPLRDRHNRISSEPDVS